MTELQVARAGAFDDIPIYALADGSRLKVWDKTDAPDPALVNLWLDPADEILKRYDAADGWTDAGIVGQAGEKGEPGESIKGEKGDAGAPGERGPSGAKGVPGERGPKGARGDTGDKGDRGLKGDTGERGQRGYSVLSGERDPYTTDGRDGDFWVNTESARMFGPKEGGQWGEGFLLIGPRGPRGWSGARGPEGPQGEPGGGGSGPVDWSDITFDDGRPEYEGEQLGLWSDRELEPDSRLYNDPPTAYPKTTSYMQSEDFTGDTFAGNWSSGVVQTVRWYDSDGAGTEYAIQTLYEPQTRQFEVRDWDPVAGEWTEFTPFALYDHTHDHIVPLAEDSHAETDPITDYPSGISIMGVSAEADWNGTGSQGHVVTERNGSSGRQIFVAYDSKVNYLRVCDSDAWEPFRDTLAAPDVLGPLSEDIWGESTPATGYETGITTFTATDAANWNGLGHYGIVTTNQQGAEATQEFWDMTTGLTYGRYSLDGFTWSEWSSGTGLDQATADTLYEPLDSAYTKAESDTRYVNETDHTKAAHDALDIDADTLDGHDTSYFAVAGAVPTAHAASHKGDGSDAIANATTSVAGLESAADKTKLDGIESGATADQSAAEILTAIKTVDGAGSGLDADTLDGHDTAYFAAAGAAPATHATTHTNGTDDIQNATSGQKGLATATQITKLDGIESGADATPDATETAKGKAELATQAETDTGTDDARIVTPLKLKTTTALDSRYYTESEVDTSLAGKVGTGRIISTTAPLTGGGDLSANRTLAVSTASETAEGVSERATQAETDTGTDDVRYVSPAKLQNTTALDSRYYTETESDTLLAAKAPTARTISTTAPLTGGGDLSANRTLAVSQGTETAQGVLELATDVETQTGTDTARAITPANLSARSATETRTGVAELATQAETNTGTDDARIVTPLKLASYTGITNKAPSSRLINTTAPLTGGGDLSADRTLAVSSSSETAQGVIEIATQTEMNTGTDDVRAVTPLKARTANDARYLQSVTQATETTVGGGEIATQTEFNTGTDATRIVTADKIAASSAHGLHRSFATVSGSDVNNAATLNFADITGLTFAVTSGVHYKFQAYIDFVVNATTTGARFSMNGPTLTRGSWRISLPPISGAAPYAPGFLQQVAFDTGTATASFTATSPNLTIIEGFFVCSASGTAAVRFASEVATANFLTIKIGSSLEYWSV